MRKSTPLLLAARPVDEEIERRLRGNGSSLYHPAHPSQPSENAACYFLSTLFHDAAYGLPLSCPDGVEVVFILIGGGSVAGSSQAVTSRKLGTVEKEPGRRHSEAKVSTQMKSLPLH